MHLTEHFFHNSCLSKHNKGSFSKERFYWIWGYWQLKTPDVFTFPEEIHETNTFTFVGVGCF